MKKRILFVLPRMPVPVHSGEKWILDLMRRFSGRFDLSLFSFLTPGEELRQSLFAMTLERRLGCRVHALKHPSLEAGNPPAQFPEAAKRLYSEAAAAAMREICRSEKPDLVHFHYLEIAHYVDAVPAGTPTVMTEHDSSHFTARSYLRRRGARDREWLKMRSHAREYYSKFGRLTVLSQQDRRQVGKLLPAAAVDVIPLGVQLPEIGQSPPPAAREPATLLFVGNYRHFPNEDAVVYFCGRILPLIAARVPQVKVLIVGAHPTPAVLALAGGRVTVTGEVPEVRPYLERAAVFIAPVRLGAGVKGKVLEALACGLPVVASREVAAGFEQSGAQAMLAAENAEDFAAKTAALLGDVSLQKRLAEAGRDFVARQYDNGPISESFGRLYESMTGTSPPRPAGAAPGGLTPRHVKLMSRIEEAVAAGSRRAAGAPASDGAIRELYLELTHRCDLKCVMCEHWKVKVDDPQSPERELSAESLKKRISESRLFDGVQQVVVTGGEPLLRRDIVELLCFLHRRFPSANLVVLTNLWNTGSLRRRLEELRRAGVERFLIGTSIDGLSGVHDLVRGQAGAFDGLVKSVALIQREHPGLGLSFTFTITPENYRSLHETYLFVAETLGCGFGAQFAVPREGVAPIVWPKGALKEAERQIEAIIASICGRPGAPAAIDDLLAGRPRASALWREIAYWWYLRKFNRRQKPVFEKCMSGQRYAMLDCEGNVFFCPISRDHTIGSIKDADFDELWSSPRAAQERERVSSCQCSGWIRCIANPIVDRSLSLAGL